MPRDKDGQADQAAAASAAADHTCQLCQEDVDVEEDHIKGMCSSCGERRYHTDCIIRLMIAKTKEVSNSAQAGKLKIYAQKRPAHQFELQCGRCPLKTASGEDCPGHIVSAEQVKPQKPVPAAPPPPQPPPRGGRSGAQHAGNPAAPAMPRAAKLRGAGSWIKQARPSPRATLGPAEPAVDASGELRDRLGVLLPSAGEAGAAGDKAKKQRRHGKATSTLTFAPGTRPDKLRLCSNWQGCRVHGCVFAHSQDELAAREAEWEEQVRLEAKRKEKEEAERQRAALEEELLDRQARQQLGEHVAPLQPESVLLLSDHAISLVKAHKHSYCINSLMEMGFDPASAQAASLATGAAVEAAAEALALGALEDLSGPPREVDVSRELDRLLATASLMAATAADVEARLQAFGGNWEAAEEALLQQAGGRAEAHGVEGYSSGAAAAAAAAASDVWEAGYGAASAAGASAAAGVQEAAWEQASSWAAAAPGAAAAVPGGAAAFDTGTSWAVSEDFGLPSELAAPVAPSSSSASITAGGQYGSTAQHGAAVSQLASQAPGALAQPAPSTPAPAPAQNPPGPPAPAIAAVPAIVPPLGAPDPEVGSEEYQAWVQEALARLGLQGGRAEAAGTVAGAPAVAPGAASGTASGAAAGIELQQQPLGQGVAHEAAAGSGDVDWAAVLGGGEVAPAALEAGPQSQQAEQAPAAAAAAAPAMSVVGLDWSASKQPAQYAMRAVAGQQQAVAEQQDADDLQDMLALLCGS